MPLVPLHLTQLVTDRMAIWPMNPSVASKQHNESVSRFEAQDEIMVLRVIANE